MVTLGYFLSSEEHDSHKLVEAAVLAERAGFRTATISDHFHPWLPEQGQSPFVWSVLGAIAQATTELRVTTAVVCPTIRIHPAIIAQAAATTQQLFGGRFALGLGSGEALMSAICQHTSLARPCAAWPHLEPSVLTSWDDVMLSMALESNVWGPHSLHTGEVTESCETLLHHHQGRPAGGRPRPATAQAAEVTKRGAP